MPATETLDCCPALEADMNMAREAAAGPGSVHVSVRVTLCRGALMPCDWGQCCQQSRDMDAAQVPPCINVGAGGEARRPPLTPTVLTLKGPIRDIRELINYVFLRTQQR